MDLLGLDPSPRKAADGSVRGPLGQSAHSLLFGQYKTPLPKPSGNEVSPKKGTSSSSNTPKYEIKRSSSRKKTWGDTSQVSSGDTSRAEPLLMFSSKRRAQTIGVVPKELDASPTSKAPEIARSESKPQKQFSRADMSRFFSFGADCRDVSGTAATDSVASSSGVSGQGKTWIQPEKQDASAPLMFSRKRLGQNDRSCESTEPVSPRTPLTIQRQSFTPKEPLSPSSPKISRSPKEPLSPVSPRAERSRLSTAKEPSSDEAPGSQPQASDNANRKNNVEILHSFVANLETIEPEPSSNNEAKESPKRKLLGASRGLLAAIDPHAAALKAQNQQNKKEEEQQTIAEEHKDEDVWFTLTDQAVLRRYFTMRDADGSGSLDVAELMNVMDDMGRLPPKGSEDAVKLEQLRIELDDNGNGELEFDEFLIFLAAYYRSVYERVFNSWARGEKDELVPMDKVDSMFFDLRAAGFHVDYDELGGIMNKFEYQVGHYISFKDFCEMMKHYRFLEFCHLQKNAGFSPERMAFLQHLFEEHDADQSGSLDIKEIAQLFEQAFQPIEDIDRFVELFARTDVDKSASLDFEEFLRLFGVWNKEMSRDAEKEKASEQPGGSRRPSKENKSGKTSSVLARASTIASLKSGKTMNFDLVDEEEEKDEEKKKENEFTINYQKEKDLNDLYNKVLGNDVEDGILAKQWEISLGEVRALRESFEFCDADGSGTIDHGELVPLLGNVGFPLSTKMQKSVLNSCLHELKGDEDLDFRDIVILIVTYNKFLAHAVVESMGVFGKYVPVNKLVLAYYQIGQQMTKDKVEKLLKIFNHEPDAMGVDEATFSKMLAHHRSQSLMEWRKTCGFEEEIIAEFAETVETMSGSEACNGVSLAEALLVLQELGYAPKQKADLDTLMHALTRVDRNASGRLSFDELLLLLRHLENRRQVKVVEAENAMAESIGLDADSVKLIRNSFNSYSEGPRGLVTQLNIKILLSSKFHVVHTQSQRKQLDSVLNNISENSEELEFSFEMFLQVLANLDDSGLF